MARRGAGLRLQTTLAVTVGSADHAAADDAVRGVGVAIFLLGAFVLFRTARGADEAERETEEEYAGRSRVGSGTFLRSGGTPPSWCCSLLSGATSPSC